MKYCTISETAKKWNVSKTLVRRYIQQNRIPKVVQKGGVWLIPENAKKPDALNMPIYEDVWYNNIIYKKGGRNMSVRQDLSRVVSAKMIFFQKQ